MQNYGQPQGYQRPGSTASFAGQAPPPPPGYGGGYQSAAPQAQSQWAAPTPTQTQNPWNQTQQQQQQQQPAAGGYQPSTYGAMPGGYAQTQQASYPNQQHDKPPPPPPKPYGFAGAVQQQQQHQQAPAQPQYTPQTQQGGYPVQGTPQQPYNSAAPPPPSATPGGSYFPPTQGGRPGSIYGAPAATPQQASTVISPNEQQPAYIPPSLSGQGVQAYMPSNTNPAPGVYVPPPPDIPAWQQAQHAPLQGGSKKFRYTKPTVDPSFYAQGYQGIQPMQPQQGQQPQGQFAQPGMQPPQAQQVQQQYGQPVQTQYGQQGQTPQQVPPPYVVPQQLQQHGQYGPTAQPQGQFQPQPLQQGFSRPPPALPPQAQQAPPPQAHQPPPAPQYPPQQNQWQSPAQEDPNFKQQQHPIQPAQQQQWQPGHQTQASVGQQYPQVPDQSIQAPKPLSRTDTAPSAFFNQPSPQSQPVSPVTNRQSMSFGTGHQTGLGRAGSVSSIALANLQAQRADNRTSSPKPAPPKMPTPPPPRDDKSKFSALGTGGPSDWEHFGIDDEIDDEHFFAKKDDKPAQLDSVELPAHVPSPPSTHGWPSPATQPAPLNSGGRRDTYAPTPPPVTASPAQRPPSQPPQQNYVLGDAMVAPLKTSPKPMQAHQPPPVQQSFEMGGGGWNASKQSTPAQQHSQYQPPPPKEDFVVNDGGWAAQSAPPQPRQHTPAQPAQQPPPVQTGFAVSDGGWGMSQQTPTQASGNWGAQPNNNHAAELKAKDEAFGRLQADSEREKVEMRAAFDKEMADRQAETERERSDLRAEIENLKANAETARSSAAAEATTLQRQIESLNAATTESKSTSDASIKERDMTIERLKEDVEGKEHNIEERDAIIADLKRELEAEKIKEVPRPTPADLVPDIDPWYAGSLERYIAMLRSEAHEPEIENKINTFRSFLRSESAIRGIEYFDAPPPAQMQPPPAPVQEPRSAPEHMQHVPHQEPQNPPKTERDLNISVPQAPPEADEYEYSPGGRPMLRRKPTIPSSESHPELYFGNSVPSTSTLTPTSSPDDEMNKTPVQSPPENQQQPQYKAYVPAPGAGMHVLTPTAGMDSNDNKSTLHRPTTTFSSAPLVVAPLNSNISKGHDEIFFGAGPDEPKAESGRPTTSDSNARDAEIPAPLKFSSSRPLSVAAPLKAAPTNKLADLLPSRTAPTEPHHSISELRSHIAEIKPDSHDLADLTKTWEASAAPIRRKNDSARRKRQEENEEHNDDLFNNNEISYAEMNQLEDEFKQKEAGLKAQEDRDEYKNFVDVVFDPVYEGLQADIKSLMDLYIDAENLLHSSVSGVKSLEGANAPSTLDTLELLKDLHSQIEARHDKVVSVVAERDKRYKKTEIQPLYASGNISKMKSVERHFENAEKQAVLRAKRDKAERVGELVNMAEDLVVRAVGVEQSEIDDIIAAIRDIDDGAGDADLLNRAHAALKSLKTSSKALLSLFNVLEIQLNDSVLDAEIAEAKANPADAGRVPQLEAEKAAGAKKMADEYARRVAVLEQDSAEIEELVVKKGGVGSGSGSGEGSEEAEREKRLRTALEEAKKRNGHA